MKLLKTLKNMKHSNFQKYKTVSFDRDIYYWYIQQEAIKKAGKIRMKKSYLF